MGNTKKKRCQENVIEEEYNARTDLVRKEHLRKLRLFKIEQRQTLMTTRFSEYTWQQNKQFREKHSSVGCFYGSTIPISGDVAHESVLFVLEMNNTTNRIMGVGLVRNRPVSGKYVAYPDNMNVNRFLFIGQLRVDRTEMTEEEEEVMRFFDIICFTGARHMKRGNGMTRFPLDILYRCSEVMNLTKFIGDMLKKRMNAK
jgi:hypothetical protein